jgi:predicted metalloprotease with PDZ domain
MRENYTTLLWAFEGFTSYYDDLALLRCGVIKRKGLAGTGRQDDRQGPARPRPPAQTLAESSFDAWTKYYRPDENTPNAVVSYYAKGALVALALDLTLRARSESRVSLDDVMRALWQRHGAGMTRAAACVEDEDIRLIAEELSGLDLDRFFAEAVHGTTDLDLARPAEALRHRLKCVAASGTPSLGATTGNEGNDVRLTTV